MQYLLQYIYNAAGFDLFKKKRSTGRRVVFLFGISFSLLFPLWFLYISYKLRPLGDYKKVTSLYSTQLHVDTENLSS